MEEHLYRYGTYGEISFKLNLNYDAFLDENILKRVDTGYVHTDKCHFLELHEDLFTSLICLNMRNHPSARRHTTTPAGLYEEYWNNSFNFKNEVDKIVQNSLALEILAHWAICFASHCNTNGEADGVQVFTEFVKKLQPFDTSQSPFTIEFTGLDVLPPSLVGILSKVTILYLVRFPRERTDQVKSDLAHYLGDFVKFGRCQIPADRVQIDVIFDLKYGDDPMSNTKLGFIECKLWGSKPVGASQFYIYYQRACVQKYPISFLICHDLQTSLKPETLTKPKTKTKNPPETKTKTAPATTQGPSKMTIKKSVAKPATKKTETEDPIEVLNGMWASSENHIDIYTVRYSESSIIDPATGITSKINANFAVKPLKTFPNPKGAFILIETKFKPPTMSGDY